MTRSKAKSAKSQTTYIPVGFKLFKLIINEMMTQMENEENDDDASDDEVRVAIFNLIFQGLILTGLTKTKNS